MASAVDRISLMSSARSADIACATVRLPNSVTTAFLGELLRTGYATDAARDHNWNILQDLGVKITEVETDLGLIVGEKMRDATESAQVAGAIFLALLATTFGTLIAIPLSFMAARNLMAPINAPLAAIMAAIVAAWSASSGPAAAAPTLLIACRTAQRKFVSPQCWPVTRSRIRGVCRVGIIRSRRRSL